jgi:hypothetical protein
MSESPPEEPILVLLRAIEANQIRALELQSQALAMSAEQLTLARAQAARYENMATESVQLQRVAVQRQQQAIRWLVPALGALAVLLAYSFFHAFF